MKTPNLNRPLKILSWSAVGLWSLGLFLLSGLPGQTADMWLHTAGEWLIQILAAMLQPLPAGLPAFLDSYLSLLLLAAGYMALAALSWNALRLSGLGMNAAAALALAITTLYGVIDELHQILIPGRLARIGDWAVGFGASLFLLACTWLFQMALLKFPKFVNRETVSYVVFGVLTTLVNIVTYLLCKTALDAAGSISEVARTLVSTSVAWLIAVLFAYVVNKLFVFQSKTDCARAALREFALFIAARLFSYAVDALGMVLMVNIAHLGDAFSKIIMNIVVMVMNYFFSKWFIFNKDRKKETA